MMVFGSIYQGAILVHVFEPPPHEACFTSFLPWHRQRHQRQHPGCGSAAAPSRCAGAGAGSASSAPGPREDPVQEVRQQPPHRRKGPKTGQGRPLCTYPLSCWVPNGMLHGPCAERVLPCCCGRRCIACLCFNQLGLPKGKVPVASQETYRLQSWKALGLAMGQKRVITPSGYIPIQPLK